MSVDDMQIYNLIVYVDTVFLASWMSVTQLYESL